MVGGAKAPSYIYKVRLMIKIKVMLENFNLQSAQELMNNKEVLNQEERDMCVHFLPEMTTEYLFHNSWNNTYLNLNVYSEVEKEEYDLHKEMGY
jgi:hypothetical protein